MHVWFLLAAAMSASVVLQPAPVSAGLSIQKPLSFNNHVLGTLSLDSDGKPFTFHYSTPEAHGDNWIGLYHASGGGPENQSFVTPSLVWEYAPQKKGGVHLSVDSLQPGEYRAYFLAQNGYRWLAQPVNVTLKAPPADLYFPVANATLHNARQFEHFSARIDGLLLGKGDAKVGFEKAEGHSWIQVGSNGSISGQPGLLSPRRSTVLVRAVADNGSTAEIRLLIPVRRFYQSLVGDLRILTYNMWFGGTQVSNYHEKQLRFLLQSGADIVGLQETTSDHAARLGKALGWYYWQSTKSVGIISRYPIVKEYGEISRSGGVRINLNGRRPVLFGSPFEINFWTTHLGFDPYGPYDFCYAHMSPDEVTAREAESGRMPQMIETLEGMGPQLDNSYKVPVIFTGDFNAPSHLDWVESLREKNCGVANYAWPTSILPTERGLVDSFRIAHPDPAAEQGTTWSPILPGEPQDRIDFIYHTGRLKVVDSRRLVVGEPKSSPDHRDNEWTSDHATVLTHYRLPWWQ